MMISPFDLSGAIIMVTGASAGIGKATAQVLSQLGARIILVSRYPETLKATEATLVGEGHLVAPFDFDNVGEIGAWYGKIAASVGILNGLVHCAGCQILRPLKVISAPEAELLLRRNALSGLFLAKAFRQKGLHAPLASLVFVSSVMGTVGAPGSTAYCASKGAVHGMVKALALELAAEDIRVNCVAPGYVRTGMLESVAATVGPEAFAALQKNHPLGLGEPVDVANAIAFLLSKASRWITGTALVVDGGYTAQ
jgi:NAD(P)-dependent dehydrogenase (short-subunit alcohol dehydrogenase family)